MIEKISNTSELENKITETDKEIAEVKKTVEQFIAENARCTLDQQEYTKKIPGVFGAARQPSKAKRNLAE